MASWSCWTAGFGQVLVVEVGQGKAKYWHKGSGFLGWGGAGCRSSLLFRVGLLLGGQGG